MVINPFDTQVGGSHYKNMKIQPVEFIVANGLSFLEGNAVKYICRHRAKHGVQDIEKAIHYLEMIRDEYQKTTGSIAPTFELYREGPSDTQVRPTFSTAPYHRN